MENRNLACLFNENYNEKIHEKKSLIKRFGNRLIDIPYASYLAPTYIRKREGIDITEHSLFHKEDIRFERNTQEFSLGLLGTLIHGLGYLMVGISGVDEIFDLNPTDLIHLPLATLPIFTNSISKGYEIFMERIRRKKRYNPQEKDN